MENAGDASGDDDLENFTTIDSIGEGDGELKNKLMIILKLLRSCLHNIGNNCQCHS